MGREWGLGREWKLGPNQCFLLSHLGDLYNHAYATHALRQNGIGPISIMALSRSRGWLAADKASMVGRR